MTKLIHVFSAPISAYIFMKGQLEYMTKKGMQITVVMPYDKEFNLKFKDLYPEVKVININFKRKINIYKDIVCLFQLILVIKKNNPDIIHLHTPKASFLGAIASRILFKNKIIYQMHGLVSSYGNKVKKGFLFYLEKFTCILSTHIFAVSNSLMELAIVNNYCKRKKISVIHNGTINGIDYENKFNPSLISKNNYKLNEIIKNKFVVGFVGRLSLDKGIDDYLNVISMCKIANIPAVGILIGPDESCGYLYKLLNKYKLVENEDVFILGQQLKPENFIIYFDVLLFPSKREGFGLVATESNSLEVPVVGYDITGLRDAVINDFTGKLVDFENTDLLFESVKFYYTNPNIRLQHGKNGRIRVINDFSQKKIWKHIYNSYTNFLD